MFRELTTDRGLRASSKLEGVNNAEWVEQRSDEEKQVEEQVKAYRNTLHNFVSVDKNTGAISSRLKAISLNSPDAVEAFLNQVEFTSPSHLLLSEEEAMAFKSLLMQERSLNITKMSLELQKYSIEHNAKNLLLQYNSIDTFDYQQVSDEVQLKALRYERKNYSFLTDDTSIDSDWVDLYYDQMGLIGKPNVEQGLSDETKMGLVSHHKNVIIPAMKKERIGQKSIIRSQISNFPDIGAPKGIDGTLTKQYNNTQDQYIFTKNQICDICLQINLYVQKSAKYIEQVKGYYKEYLNLQNRLDLLRAQVPVSYLISDDVIKGFNAKGDLVIVQDKYGKYVVMERRKYNVAGATRISAIYDKDGNTMSFLYNENDRLSQIGNSLGERVSFRYDDDGYLTGIEREKLPALTLEYISLTSGKRIKKISSSDQTFTSFSYNLMGMLTQITGNTAVSAISHRNIVLDKDSVLSTVKIAYTDTDTEITYDKTKQEIYRVDQEAEQVVAYYETINGLVTKAENYTYTGNLLTRTEYAHRSCLNRYGVADFAENFMPETIKETTYNSFREPTATDVLRYESSPDFAPPAERTQTEYTYNDDHRLTMTRATHQYFESNSVCSSSVAVEKYYYNNMGETVRTESYVEGEELKTGIRIEEHEFNEDGVEIRTVTRNSLDPSSGFYTEQEVDKEGRTLAAFDESGKHKTAYKYTCDGVNVRSEHLPNGSVLSYGRAKDDTVNAVTHSTDAGEENSTTRLSTLDAITEVRSGTHTVGYTYDGKRRISSVSLYGKDNYVKYTYSGEHTNAEKVRAELADGTVFTSVKDLSGNVTQTTCGDRSVNNTYNTDRQLTESVDSVSGTTAITYDAKGNIQTVTAPGCAESYTYDVIENFLMSRTVSDGDFTHNYAYSYKQTADRALDHMTVDGKTVTPATDALGRNTGKTIAVGGTRIAEEKISYVKSGDHATNMPSTIRFASPFNGTYGFNESIQYRYDDMGNIIEVSENGRPVCRYEYDALGRLTREDNKALQKTICFAYDNGGNILARYEYALTSSPTEELYPLESSCKAYVYEKDSDRLLSYNGESFAYDTIGNPTTYRGKSATWAYGRQLTGFNGNTFAYDARGRRTGKNNLTFTYDSNGNLVKQSNGLEFLYDHTGIFAIKYNNSTYFYRKNAQQDVIALLDNTGKVVVKYRYDAWGKCQTTVTDDNASMIAELNPFRYRSYYYDTETGFYFLQTRYYDPEIGRFMTIDDISYLDPESVNGLNLYAYCLNNPVMCMDASGTSPEWWQWVLSGISLVAGIALCFVPGMQGFGIALIVGGATSMVSNIMSAAGVDGKTASIVSGALNVVAGIALCFVPGTQGLGASLIGSGVLGIAGGYLIESLGGSFELGSAIGSIVGSFIGGQICKGLQRIGAVGVYAKVQDLTVNPADEFTKLGPSDRAISYWTKNLAQNPRGYNSIPDSEGRVEVIKVIRGTNIISNGHHRVYVMKYVINNAPKYIKVYFTK